MIEPNDALNRLRRANLLPSGAVLDDDELAAAVAECERRVAQQRGTAVPESRMTGESVWPVPGSRPRWRPALVFSVAFVTVIAVVAVVALFSDTGAVILEPDVASDIVESATPVPSGTIGNVAYIDELVFYEDADRTLQTSVFFPLEGEAPFPIVVLYGIFQEGQQERELARKIADRGAVVVAPIWVDESYPDLTVDEYLGGAMWDRASCAVGYAQAHAESYGGAPARTTVMGDAGGEHPAAWVALGLADTSDCPEPVRSQPTGLVAGQSQWFFQEAQFDDAFNAEGSAGDDTVDRFFNPERWDPAEDLKVFLWLTAWAGNSNEISNPPAEESWIWSRDPDGDIIEDLAVVGAFDDGLITFSDNTRLMDMRMAQAGIDVTSYEIDNSGVSTDDAAFDRIWQLIAGQ